MPATRWVLHVDLDQFIAAVEVLRRPELAGKPMIVGGVGDPTQRAVVATASYEAREFRVHSGQPLRTAARLCPHAVFLASDPATYEEVSRRVMETLREFDVPVEILGWDEAFLAVNKDGPESVASEIQRAIWANTRLSCSVGMGENKPQAKLATGFAKPAGRFRLTMRNWYEVMGKLPTDALWGIGRKTARKLAGLNLRTVAELAAADSSELAAHLGPAMGPWYSELARGRGSAEVVSTPHVPRSRGRETTFQRNLDEWADIRDEVAVLARKVAQDISPDGRPVGRVAVKVRFAPFHTRTHSMSLAEPTADASTIEQAALAVLDHFERHRPVRLLGVRAEFDQSAQP